MTSEDKRIAEALERIAWALEAIAKTKSRAFKPTLPDPYEEDRKAQQAKAKAQPYPR